jgi:hypothetical protein
MCSVLLKYICVVAHLAQNSAGRGTSGSNTLRLYICEWKMMFRSRYLLLFLSESIGFELELQQQPTTTTKSRNQGICF